AREHERAARTCGAAGAARQCARKTRESRRQIDRLSPRCRMECLIRRNLADDEERRTRREIPPAADAEREHQSGGEALNAGRASLRSTNRSDRVAWPRHNAQLCPPRNSW